MIDLHAHILPGLDDGAKDLAVSLEMARSYVAEGFTHVVATPHAVAGETPAGYARTVTAAVEGLNRALREHALSLRVLPGMEVTLDPRLPNLVADGTLLTLAGRNHLLVDTPFGRLPLGWRNVVFDLAGRGVTVVFAHPERCEQIMNDRTILTAMAKAGARLQVNYDSFAGRFGPDCTHLARWMAAEGLIHCLATDTHDLKKRHPGNTGRLREELIQRLGADNLRRLSLENPERALRGREMLEMDRGTLPRQDRRNWWQRWLSR